LADFDRVNLPPLYNRNLLKVVFQSYCTVLFDKAKIKNKFVKQEYQKKTTNLHKKRTEKQVLLDL
jgi:hypothetical protein